MRWNPSPPLLRRHLIRPLRGHLPLKGKANRNPTAPAFLGKGGAALAYQGDTMEQKNIGRRFDGSLWFENELRRRTREALNEKGLKAGTGSPVYRAEYARQLEILRAERAEVKRRRAEKLAQRLARDEDMQHEA